MDENHASCASSISCRYPQRFFMNSFLLCTQFIILSKTLSSTPNNDYKELCSHLMSSSDASCPKHNSQIFHLENPRTNIILEVKQKLNTESSACSSAHTSIIKSQYSPSIKPSIPGPTRSSSKYKYPSKSATSTPH